MASPLSQLCILANCQVSSVSTTNSSFHLLPPACTAQVPLLRDFQFCRGPAAAGQGLVVLIWGEWGMITKTDKIRIWKSIHPYPQSYVCIWPTLIIQSIVFTRNIAMLRRYLFTIYFQNDHYCYWWVRKSRCIGTYNVYLHEFTICNT